MKKKCIFPVAVAAIMLVPLLALAAGPLNRITYMATYNYNNLTVGSDTLGGVTYATVSYNGMYNGGEPGMPSLPIDYLKFSVPYNATNFTVTASGGQWTNRNLDYMVYPCQAPRFTDAQAPPIMLPDTSAYFSGNPYPSQMAWVVDEGFLAGENHIVTVAVMPLRYSHSSSADVLSGARRCNLVLSYDLSDSLAISPIIRNDSLLREEGYQLTRSMVVNPNKVKNFAPTRTLVPTPGTGFIQGGIGGDEINGGGYGGPEPIDSLLPPPGVDTTGISTELILNYSSYYPYLIVTTPELKHAVRRIAALKRQKGYNVKVVTMDDVIPSAFAGSGDVVGEGSNAQLTYTDPAGKLRQFIRNYYKFFGTKYVLLAGSSIPYHHRNDTIYFYNDYNQLVSEVIDGISDFYYIELNSDWSANKLIDHSPDLYVGRILSDSAIHIYNYANKLLRYELNPGNGDNSYLQRLCFQEGNTLSPQLQQFKNIFSPGSSPFPYQIDFGEDTTIVYPTGKNVIDTLNRYKAGLLCIFNHGDTSRIRVYGPDGQRRYSFIESISSISNGNGLNCLNNRYSPMICYIPTCTTVPFDNHNGINIGKSFTTGKDYGGPIYIGHTRKINVGTSSFVVSRFAQRIKEGYYVLGEADALSVEENMKNIKPRTFFQDASLIHVYLGDPSLEIWTGVPQSYSNVTVQRTDNGITVSGIDVDSTIIAYYCKNNMKKQKIVTTPINTPISLDDASPNSPIMLFKHNYLPYIAPLLLQNERINNSKYIIANDVLAGNAIDSNRTTSGDVVIKDGIEYEIEAKGTVTLEDGFKVEKGATFAVYPSSSF